MLALSRSNLKCQHCRQRLGAVAYVIHHVRYVFSELSSEYSTKTVPLTQFTTDHLFGNRRGNSQDTRASMDETTRTRLGKLIPISTSLGLFRPGLAWKPRLWLGLRGLRLFKSSGRAKASGKGLALAWPGFGPRLFKAVGQGLAAALATVAALPSFDGI